MPKVTAFRLGLAVWLGYARPGLRHDISHSAARSKYGCTAWDGDLFFIMEAVFGKIERERHAPRLQIIFSIPSII